MTQDLAPEIPIHIWWSATKSHDLHFFLSKTFQFLSKTFQFLSFQNLPITDNRFLIHLFSFLIIFFSLIRFICLPFDFS